MAVSSTNSNTSLGASAIDVAGIVEQLMTVENKPLEKIKTQIEQKKLVISDLGTIKSKVATFQDTLKVFQAPTTFNNSAASSSDATVVSATAGNGAIKGNHSVTVTSLATATRNTVSGYASSTVSATVDAATGFAITVAGTTYNTNGSKTVNGTTTANAVTVLGASPTITDLKNWINGLGVNVSASVVETTTKVLTAQPPSAVSYSSNVEIIEMDRMRKLIAKHMVDSKHISPHVTSFAEADVTNMVLWRDRVKKQFEKENNSKITFTPMFIECVTKVMKRFPFINASLDGDKIIVKKDYNIGMATALPSGNLVVPVIKGADMLNLIGLSKTVNGLADAARNNKLKPDDTANGTFTITNVGTFGSLMGTPIINQPQVAILAVGAIKKRPVVVETPEGDTIGIRHMMYLSLSYDHRIVDGSIGASFLTTVAKEFEKWDVNREW